MRWLFLALTLLLTGYMANGQRGMSANTSVYNEEGKLQMLISYNPSCSCRTYTEYYPDGKVYARRVFKITDKSEYIDGEDVTLYHDGSIKQYKLWKNAVPDGRAYANYENGKLEYEEFYNDGLKTGTWKYYDKNGALVRERIFEGTRNVWNSKKDDYTSKIYSGGRIAYTEVFSKGRMVKTDRKTPAANAVPARLATDSLSGKKLFAAKCAACHALDKGAYGPALKGVTGKRTNIWLHRMITNGMKLVEEGDKDAVALYEQYQKRKHFAMEQLSYKQVQSIIDYLKNPD